MKIVASIIVLSIMMGAAIAIEKIFKMPFGDAGFLICAAFLIGHVYAD